MRNHVRNTILRLAREEEEEEQRKRKRNDEVPLVRRRKKKKRADPRQSQWYIFYIKDPLRGDSDFESIFRLRFRLPYDVFLELVGLLQLSETFTRWKNGSKDALGRRSAPLTLLVLCALRYLGRAWTFDDLMESTGIGKEVIRSFFHQFVEFGGSVLFQRWVIQPSNTNEAAGQMHEFTEAGLPGAIGSMDATHVPLDCVQYKQLQAHKGFKSNIPCRAYNIVCNHRRRILSSTTGHPARWNDKTLITFDTFVMEVHEGKRLRDLQFQLYDYNGNGEVMRRRYRGAWFLTDNGYHKWSTTIPPFRASTSRKEIRFSKWLESMRKDVECTFGILKKRWRILKTGIRTHRTKPADNIWRTCCALHNWLLENDGMDVPWDQSIVAPAPPNPHEDDLSAPPRVLRRLLDEEEEDDERENNEEADDESVLDDPGMHRPPAAIVALLNPVHEIRNEDRGYDGRRQSESSSSSDDEDEDGGGGRTDDNNAIRIGDSTTWVHRMSQNAFRSKLVTHFDIAFNKGEVKWPSRTGRRRIINVVR